ncbi:hypothetical protein GCM10010358_76940 [Streptomyces minutiscleroticus]|uniref:Uncharacterized protein n=1 Tax=Streptomyces minutiscleroticus TaxID=68238 RepID=A0A918P2Y5_9ACTN|nr:hypothetical protein GCM10010358_76940 [Streptomyces minutiscleroticus]
MITVAVPMPPLSPYGQLTSTNAGTTAAVSQPEKGVARGSYKIFGAGGHPEVVTDGLLPGAAGVSDENDTLAQ